MTLERCASAPSGCSFTVVVLVVVLVAAHQQHPPQKPMTHSDEKACVRGSLRVQPCGAFDRVRALDGDESRSTFFFTPSVGVLFYCSLRLPGWDVAPVFHLCLCGIFPCVCCHDGCPLSLHSPPPPPHPRPHTPLSCITHSIPGPLSHGILTSFVLYVRVHHRVISGFHAFFFFQNQRFTSGILLSFQ